MDKPHGGDSKDDSKSGRGTTSGGGGVSSCGSSSGSTGDGDDKMEVEDSLVLASLPSSSSITITKASYHHHHHHRQTHNTTAGNREGSKGLLGPDMMPTIPLVPVQVPGGSRGSTVTLPKLRGRPKGGLPTSPGRGGLHVRRGLKMKRLGMRGRGRRLTHSMSLEERSGGGGSGGGSGGGGSGGGSGDLRKDSPLPLDEETYTQDDMCLTPSFPESWGGRVCALCCLGEGSQLGQGELLKHDRTPGFTLPEKLQASATPDVVQILQSSQATQKFKAAHANVKEKGKSPRKQVGEALPEPVEEISLVGHTEQPSISTLFEASGECLVHYMCGVWSGVVEVSSEDTLTQVDNAVVVGATTRCHHCNKFGATIPCKVSDCPKSYHFPCAMGSGATMDLKSLCLVCPTHMENTRDLLDLACMVCESWSPESTPPLLFCCSCGNHYHASCLKPPLTPSPVVRAGWQCPDCKSCQMCRQPSDEMVCGVCDKAYHVVCARPFGLSLCRTGWKCKTCRVCGDCGSRTPGNGLSSRWHSNFTVCDSCYQLRNKGFACPICHKAYRAIAQKTMAQCTKCQRHVHNGCDSDADLSLIRSKLSADQSYEYVCTSCNDKMAPSPCQSPHNTHEDSCDPQDSSIHSEDSNDTDITSEGKSDDLASTPKPPSSYLSRGKPLGLAKRGGWSSKLRGADKYSLGKKTFSSGSKKRGQTMPVRRGRGGNGRGYRGYFNYQNVTLQAHLTWWI